MNYNNDIEEEINYEPQNNDYDHNINYNNNNNNMNPDYDYDTNTNTENYDNDQFESDNTVIENNINDGNNNNVELHTSFGDQLNLVDYYGGQDLSGEGLLSSDELTKAHAQDRQTIDSATGLPRVRPSANKNNYDHQIHNNTNGNNANNFNQIEAKYNNNTNSNYIAVQTPTNSSKLHMNGNNNQLNLPNGQQQNGNDNEFASPSDYFGAKSGRLGTISGSKHRPNFGSPINTPQTTNSAQKSANKPNAKPNPANILSPFAADIVASEALNSPSNSIHSIGASPTQFALQSPQSKIQQLNSQANPFSPGFASPIQQANSAQQTPAKALINQIKQNMNNSNNNNNPKSSSNKNSPITSPRTTTTITHNGHSNNYNSTISSSNISTANKPSSRSVPASQPASQLVSPRSVATTSNIRSISSMQSTPKSTINSKLITNNINNNNTYQFELQADSTYSRVLSSNQIQKLHRFIHFYAYNHISLPVLQSRVDSYIQSTFSLPIYHIVYSSLKKNTANHDKAISSSGYSLVIIFELNTPGSPKNVSTIYSTSAWKTQFNTQFKECLDPQQVVQFMELRPTHDNNSDNNG